MNKIDVAGDQNITVYGNQNVHIAGKLTEIVDTDIDRQNLGKVKQLTNDAYETTIMGGFVNFKASTEQSLTVSEKIAISAGIEASLGIGASEKVSLGGSFEQSFAYKRNIVFGNEDTKVLGIAKKRAAALKATDDGMLKEKITTIAQREAKMASHKAKMQAFNFTISMFN